MKRRITIVILFLSLISQVWTQERPNVLTSASMIADMTHQIGGDLILVESIVPIGGDPHLYEPTPGDAIKVSEADLIFINGLTFEGWITELIDNSGTKANTVTVTQGITPISSSVYDNSSDPHAWMDAGHGIIYCNNIRDALIELLPDYRSQIEGRHARYVELLSNLDNEITQSILQIPEKKRYLITSHDAFHYYGKKYQIQTESILGTSTDSDAQTSDLIRINKIIKENSIPAVFIETTVNPKLLQSLANDNKIRIGGKLYSDSLGDKDSPASTYVDMLRHNTKVIVEALTAEDQEVQEVNSSSSQNKYLFYFIAAILIIGFILILKKVV